MNLAEGIQAHNLKVVSSNNVRRSQIWTPKLKLKRFQSYLPESGGVYVRMSRSNELSIGWH